MLQDHCMMHCHWLRRWLGALSYRLFFLKHKNIFVFPTISFSTLKWQSYLKSPLVDTKDTLVLYSQHHDCWRPGDTMIQCICRHAISVVIPKYSGFKTETVSTFDLDNSKAPSRMRLKWIDYQWYVSQLLCILESYFCSRIIQICHSSSRIG